MSDDNYVSPYGFGPVTDAVLDLIAYRHDMKPDELAVALERLPEDTTSELDGRIDNEWWRDYMGVAADKMDDLLSEYIAYPEET
jgi:hypothetical protein